MEMSVRQKGFSPILTIMQCASYARSIRSILAALLLPSVHTKSAVLPVDDAAQCTWSKERDRDRGRGRGSARGRDSAQRGLGVLPEGCHNVMR